MPIHMIGAERAYPIYLITAIYSQLDGVERIEIEKNQIEKDQWQEYMLFREEPMGREVLLNAAASRWREFCKNTKLLSADAVLDVRLLHHETWCKGSFCHKTFAVRGDTPAQILASFRAFLRRRDPSYAFDGADDESNWSGHDKLDMSWNPMLGKSAAPCRCLDCRMRGIVRIDHYPLGVRHNS